MENLRIVFWGGFLFLLWLTVDQWERTYSPAPQAPVSTAEAPTGLPAAPAATGGAPELANPGSPAAVATPSEPVGDVITVSTDVFDIEISTLGGELQSVSLPGYPRRKDGSGEVVQLLNTDPATYYVIRSGLRAAGGREEATHLVPFSSAATAFELADGADVLEVPLTWQSSDGVTVTKTYRFTRGRYDIDLIQTIQNGSAESYDAAGYVQIVRRNISPDRSMFDVDSYSFIGPVIYNGESYEKLDAGDLIEEPVTQKLPGGWIASIEHHFLTAAVPPAESIENYQVTYDGLNITATSMGPLLNVAPGASGTLNATLFAGPKLQAQLNEISPELWRTVDYGVLTILAQPLFWVLQKVYNLVGNWGWAIIIVTFLIKLVFYKLTETSGRSMAKMRELQPRLKSLQDRYKDDRQALSQAMMDLYKREKVNPAAGCLPMLVQIPFFIAFYWVLLESVEMRQAPFALWLTDLSSRDPYFVLPLLMGAAMYFQQSLNPAPPDPVQAKVMQFLPVMFTVFFAFFPSGLVLYWLTNSLLSIAQQWKINRVVAAGKA